MKNSIVAKIPFYFKGELHEPSMVVDLDDWARKDGMTQSDLYEMIAKVSGMNPHGYEIEVMAMSEMVFESPVGRADMFYDSENQQLDFDGFRNDWKIELTFERLNRISQDYLAEPLIKGSEMHQALLAAFEMGRND
ncbi:hypothetical protein [Hydrogenovibrio kuenenii]|uniref:hypothetical protein n=1 Tax=Hydrogenovibrio kuenenii TaxID=63658 RepID=UPI00046660A2|nr:hypothetical protein [Hydrogenovibrio kuenenii]